MIESYYFLIVGRCGSGKSATTRYLTGLDTIESKISPNSVTTEIAYHESTPARQAQTNCKIGVLDIPGLDSIYSRQEVRGLILKELQNRNMQIDGILYTLDCTARDTVDNDKIFNFLNELPWSYRDTRDNLYPILTKYDNLIFDAEDENTKHALDEFGDIFDRHNYGESWRSNCLYWVNYTKNIEQKMKIYNEIKEVYESQLHKLLKMVRKKKAKLTLDRLQHFLLQENLFIEKTISRLVVSKEIAVRTLACFSTQQLLIEITPNNEAEKYTALTLGSLGVMLARVVQNSTGKAVLAMGSALIAGGVLIKNLLKNESSIKDLRQQERHVRLKYDRNYVMGRVSDIISSKVRQFEQRIQYRVEGNSLVIILPKKIDEDVFSLDERSVEDIILDGMHLQRKSSCRYEYPLINEGTVKTVSSEIKIKLNVLIPEEHSLLEKLEKDSFNFKQEVDRVNPS